MPPDLRAVMQRIEIVTSEIEEALERASAFVAEMDEVLEALDNVIYEDGVEDAA